MINKQQMILNLKNKRHQQNQSIASINNSKTSNQIKSHRDEIYKDKDHRQSKEAIKSTRINSQAGNKKNNAMSTISTVTGANSSSHTHVGTHYAYYNDSSTDQEHNQKGQSIERQYDLNKITNAYKKIKNQLQNQPETSFQLYPQEHIFKSRESQQKLHSNASQKLHSNASQKINHKKEIIKNISNNFILVTETDQHQDKNLLERHHSSEKKQEEMKILSKLLESFNYLFENQQTSTLLRRQLQQKRNKSARDSFHNKNTNAGFHSSLDKNKNHVDNNQNTKLNAKNKNKYKQCYIELQSKSSALKNDNNSKLYTEKTVDFTFQAMIESFSKKLIFLQQNSEETIFNDNFQQKNKINFDHQKVISSSILKQFQKALQNIKHFFGELISKSLAESNQKNEKIIDLLSTHLKQQEQIKYNQKIVEKQLTEQRKQNYLLKERIIEIELKSVNCNAIFNELSRKFDLEEYIKEKINHINEEFSETFENENQFENSSAFSQSKERDQYFQDSNYSQEEGSIPIPQLKLKSSKKEIDSSYMLNLQQIQHEFGGIMKGKEKGRVGTNNFIMNNNFINYH